MPLLLLDVTFCFIVTAIESYYYAFRAQALNCFASVFHVFKEVEAGTTGT